MKRIKFPEIGTQTNYLIQSWGHDQLLISKKLSLSRFSFSADYTGKLPEKLREIPGNSPRAEIAVQQEVDGDTNHSQIFWKSTQEPGNLFQVFGNCSKGSTGLTGDQRKDRNHPDNNIAKIGKNTLKSPGHMWRFVVTRIPIKKSPVTANVKTYQEVK